jgi:starch synthase
MKILMMSSETVPYAKSGGLADMVSALSLALKQEGQDVRILMPLYNVVNREKLEFIADLQIDMVYRTESTALYSTVMGDSGIPVYFIESEKYFSRKGIYGPTPASSYPDNAHRFSLLSASFEAVCLHLNWIPDILHSHDWPTGLAPLYLNRADESFNNTASVFTIHNMGYQGTYDKRDLPWTGLELEDTHRFNMMKDGYTNFLKTAIENNDRITTVSPSYAHEIRTLAYGHGLDQSLNHRSEYLKGILNGVDYSSWNPESDRYIVPDNYSLFDMNGKARCKTRLQIKMSLDVDPKIPLFAMISRLVEQKGIEELCRPAYGVLEEFCGEQKAQVVILGTGEPWVEDELKRLSRELSNLSVKIAYSEKMSHLIEAGADFFMMPSHYEPCGLNQLYSLKYGTIPIVRKTGGLADSVSDPTDSEGWKQATGFVYDKAEPADLRMALDRAVECWEETPDRIRLLRRNGMNRDFSWKPSALAYMGVYDAAGKDVENLSIKE